MSDDALQISEVMDLYDRLPACVRSAISAARFGMDSYVTVAARYLLMGFPPDQVARAVTEADRATAERERIIREQSTPGQPEPP